jgi:hypothetical protein
MMVLNEAGQKGKVRRKEHRMDELSPEDRAVAEQLVEHASVTPVPDRLLRQWLERHHGIRRFSRQATVIVMAVRQALRDQKGTPVTSREARLRAKMEEYLALGYSAEEARRMAKMFK